MKASYQLSPAPVLLIVLLLSTFAQQARPPEPLLATVNIVHHDLSVAYTNTAEALRKSQLTDARAYLAGVLCGFHRALAPYQLAVDILTRNYGPRFTTLGVVYALRAQTLDYIGDHAQALCDYHHALSLLKHAPGRDTPAYLTVQLAYGRSLRKCGSNQEASHLEQVAKAYPANVRIQQCAGCTISAESSR
jgi:tetratricopeptide (TPR) repeat protein